MCLFFFFLLAVTPLFPQIFHRKFLMPGVMSVTLKTNVDSNFVPEGGGGSGKAEGLTGAHTGTTSHVALRLSVAAEHLVVPASVQRHIIPYHSAFSL